MENTTKLYVGGLPYTTTEAELQEYFSKAGTVTESVIIRDKMMNNRSKGFGFVTMSDAASANKAIEMFHDQEFGGRRLLVNLAKPQEKREDRRPSYGDR